MTTGAKNYTDMIEGTYVEPGHDVAPENGSTKPKPNRPLGPDGKPMMGWYYDSEGVCRPDSEIIMTTATKSPE
jgi:hypothetical protein